MRCYRQLLSGGGLAVGVAAASWVAFHSLGNRAAMTAEADEPGRMAIRNTGPPAGGAFLMDLGKGRNRAVHYLAEYEMNADWIKIAYLERNIRFSKDGMTLTLSRTPGKLPFSGGEFQRSGRYGYGRYEAVLRASDAVGAVSSFFTHTGGYFGDPHDEIDFELIGQNPREVHISYFRNGEDDPVDIPLWFNFAEADHLYAFEWAPDSIRWYVDGVKVHEVSAGAGRVAIPTTSGRVIANLWAGSGDATKWTGEPMFDRTTATCRCISHVPLGKTGAQCSDSFTPPPKP